MRCGGKELARARLKEEDEMKRRRNERNARSLLSVSLSVCVSQFFYYTRFGAG